MPHRRMVDPRQSVLVAVNGAAPVAYKVKPSLLTALESYERRRDWGLIYTMKLELRGDGDG